MKTVTPKLSLFAVAALLATLSGPVLAGNVDTYYQNGHLVNNNAAYQQGRDDANRNASYSPRRSIGGSVLGHPGHSRHGR